MRGKQDHQPPARTQQEPLDNTSNYIAEQIEVWRKTGQLIHPETAMEIAAWWQMPSNSFSQFASTGHIASDLIQTVKDQMEVAPEASPHTQELSALLAYLEACS